MLRELDTVLLTHDIPESGLKQGTRGAVVHCYSDGKAFEVEFVNSDGATIAALTVTQMDVELESIASIDRLVWRTTYFVIPYKCNKHQLPKANLPALVLQSFAIPVHHLP
jgi:hypothetical protein